MARASSLLAILLFVAAPVGADVPSRGFLDVPASRICVALAGDNECEAYLFPAPYSIPDTRDSWNHITVYCGGDNECSAAEINAALSGADGSGHVVTIPNVGDGFYDLTGTMVSVTTNNTVLRCADGVTLNIISERSSCSGVEAYMCFGSFAYSGASKAWTAGYTTGTTVVTIADASSTFSVGDYVALKANDNNCDELWNNPQAGNIGEHTRHLAKITAINGNSVTIDSPLKFDYTECTDSFFIMQAVSVSENIGLENCTIDGPDDGEDYIAMLAVVGRGTWLTSNTFLSTKTCGPSVQGAKDILIQSNDFKVQQASEDTCSGLHVEQSSDVVIENNVFTLSYQMLEVQGGADGVVIAYNYFREDRDDFDQGEEIATNRGIFIHGNYPRGVLSEGNHLDVVYDIDDLWGQNGPAVSYRQRLVDNAEYGVPDGENHDVGHTGIRHTEMNGSSDTITQHTIIGTIFAWMTGGEYYPIERPYADYENHYYDYDEPDLWFEKNVCFGEADGEPTENCMILRLEGSKAHCGSGDGSCSCVDPEQDPQPDPQPCGSCTFSTQTCGDNQMAAMKAPPTWSTEAGTDGYPSNSLYRETIPDWWCKEACDWFDVSQGIGAFGDDFGGDLCSLPAQIRLAGGPCTPPDRDGDGVQDLEDNCLETPNPDQYDSDQDGYGNRCDADYDDSGQVLGTDFLAFKSVWAQYCLGDDSLACEADHDCSGQVLGSDFTIFKSLWATHPGPSGQPCASLTRGSCPQNPRCPY